MTLSLAWAIIVDSALLNARFLEDMRDTQMAKGCTCAPDRWVPLYLPDPPPEVRHLFNDYVRCRWPLHVFAIDPETDDQNVADSFRLRREMQLALSLAFTSGQIGASSFTRYTRRIEQDIDTIAINRTMIGFSHGDNTFGWRFYPRVQTPPIGGNLQVFFRDLLIGGEGPGYLLRRRRLENGIRECSALVIMPSFVPALDLEVTGNWFRLDHPKCKELKLKQVMGLSAAIQAIQAQGGSACDPGRYRPGDTTLAMRRLDQLSERLPLQHQLVNVPFENTHGGFELLSGGTTDLGPELVGWYGAPGINPNGDTTLFLVGDNFSVHQTRVIVGGQMLDSLCPVTCATSTPGSACDCKSAAAGDGQSASSGQSSSGTTTTPGTSTPLPLIKPVMPEAQAGIDAPDAGVQLAAGQRPRSNHRAPTATNITTVMPPTPAAMTVTTTTNPTVTSSPTTTTTTTATANPTVTASPSVTTTVTPGGAAVTATGPAAPAATPTPPSPQVYQVELLSRQVMRVVIPKGVYSKDGMVDVHIATPYGVSPALQIPLVCPSPAPQPNGYSMPDANPKVTITYGFVPDRTGCLRVALIGPPQGSLRFNWKDPTGAALKLVNAAVTFNVGKSQVIAWVRLSGKNGYYEIVDNDCGKSLTAFCMSLLDGLNQLHQFAPGTPLPDSLDSAQILITPVSADAPNATPPVILPLPKTHQTGAAPHARLEGRPALRAVAADDALPPTLHAPSVLPPASAPADGKPWNAPLPGPGPLPPHLPLPEHDVQSVTVTGKITVQFQQLAVGYPPGN